MRASGLGMSLPSSQIERGTSLRIDASTDRLVVPLKGLSPVAIS